jgi:hypothetical protein
VVFAIAVLAAPGMARAQLAAGEVEFWLAPPDVSDLHNSPGGEPLYLMVAAGDAASTITIDQPSNPGFNGGVPIVVTTAALTARRVNLTAFKAALETRPTNTIVNSGLRVRATTPVTAYYEVANTNNTEVWPLPGPVALGQEFYIPLHKHAPFFNEPSFPAPHKAFASFDIVATENATVVTMFSPTPIDGHPALQQFSVTLNRGQAYSGGWTGTSWEQPSTHPSGAVVLSDKPIAVSIKDDSIHNPSGGCYDLTGASLVPVGALGQEYVAVKGSLNNFGDESVFITATQNNTQVWLDGAAAPAATLFAGEYYRVDMDYLSTSANNAVYVRTSKPVYASHLTGFGCEAGLALLPPLDLAGSRQVDLVRSTPEAFFVVIIARTASLNAFNIATSGSGATINPASFVPVPGTSGVWSAARIQYNTTQVPVDSAFRIANSSARFMLGFVNGGASSGARYGYLTQFNAPPGLVTTLTANPTTVPEPGGPVTFTLQVENTGAAPVDLQALVDDDVGSLDDVGTCAVPQAVPGAATYSCTYTATVSGSVGAVLVREAAASGVSRGVAVADTGTANVTIISELLFGDGFESP